MMGCLGRLGSQRDGRALASGALYDLSHVDAVERHGFASVLGLDLVRGPASRILGLENDRGPALVAILNPDPIASDETGGLLDARHDLDAQISGGLLTVTDGDADDYGVHSGSLLVDEGRPYLTNAERKRSTIAAQDLAGLPEEGDR